MNLYKEICSFKNLELAFKKARKGKRNKKSVQDFEFDLERNLFQIKHELETETYKPKPLKQFVIRDPKTRLISASDFRDRVVYHALCNIIQPIFEQTFIYDSHANQIKKGSSKAVERFDTFKNKASENGRLTNKSKDKNMVVGYVLKADIKHFFDTVDHTVLMIIIKRKIKDRNVLRLIKKILDNHTIKTGKGMPIGNLTSQFFANVYLNELDNFVKHGLKAKFYIRYVDDFVMLDKSKYMLEKCKSQISDFLKTIELELHPEKSQIYPLNKGVKFLGFRIFYHYKLINKKNMRRMNHRIANFKLFYRKDEISKQIIQRNLNGWFGYAQQANMYNARKQIKEKLNAYQNI